MNEENVEASVIIVSFNTRELLKECIQSLIQRTQGIANEIIVVDNASDDNSGEMIEKTFPMVHLIRSPINLGFGGANNLGFQQAKGKYIVLLNSDAFLHEGTLQKSIERMDQDPKIGLGGPQFIGRDGSWQPSARQFPSLLNDFLHLSGLAAKYPHSSFFGKADRTWGASSEILDTDWIPGAFCIIPRHVLEEVGYFDERFFLYCEEVDLCRRIKQAGYKIRYWGDLLVTHYGGESSKTIKSQKFSTTGQQLTSWRMRSTLLYYRKHHGYWGALGIRFLENSWNRVKFWKNTFSKNSANQAKKEGSQNLIFLMNQAWKDTQGGDQSPTRPW
jgi:hypothetical protein